jgi:Putative polyhydroxyalkanoic acid system protein (PHA_gran_rgn)
MGAGNQSKNAYMTAIGGSSCRIQSSSPCRTASVPKKRKGGSSSKRRNYIDKLAYSEANWNGDTANLRVVAFGQTATAQVYVLDDALRIEVQLPWILAALTGKIQGILKSNAEESLRIGHTPPKA